MSLKAWFTPPLVTADVHVNNHAPEAPLPVVEEIGHNEFPLIFKFLNEEYPGWYLGRGEILIPVGQGFVVGVPREELRRAAEFPIEKIPTLNKYSSFNLHMREFFMWRLKEGL